MMWPTEEERRAAWFENEYARYRDHIVHVGGRVAKSREGILDEAERLGREPVGLMREKMLRLEP